MTFIIQKLSLFCLLFLFMVCVGNYGCDSDKKVKKPNIVFILADDLGHGDFSCYGATKVSTPNVDRHSTYNFT